MTNHKFIKIGADGQQLPDDATEWVAVYLPAHGLTFTATSVVDTDVPYQTCVDACKALSLAGFDDWDMPTIDELQLLVDRSRYSPAINTHYFRDIRNDWYWSKTPYARSSASAWDVDFYGGYVGDLHRGYNGFALAVRRAGRNTNDTKSAPAAVAIYRYIEEDLAACQPVGQAVPAGYRLQPISEFDAYMEVLRDAERLDWLSANGYAVRKRGAGNRNLILWTDEGVVPGYPKTAREAIDAAMAAQPQGEDSHG